MTGPDAINNFGQLSAASMEALELRQQPFTDTPADGDVFADDVTEGVLTDINNALFDDYDVLLVLGEKGSGKSTLLRQLTASSQSRIACFSVKGGPRFDTAHLFGQVLDAFKTPVPTDLKDALDALMPNLQGTYERYNRLSTIVLDDADEVPVDELTKLLSSALYLNGQDEPLLRILLAAKPEFEDRLPEALPEGSEIHYATLAVEPFNTHRAKNYLEFRLNQGGYFEQFPFSDSDLQSILQQSDGNPERLNNAAAMKVNEQHGELDLAEIPPELITQNSSGHMSKMLLGGVACLMIIAGLFLFTGNEGQRSPAARVNDGYRTVETIPLSTSSSIDSTADLSADLNTQTNTISTSQSISQPSAQLELVTDAPSTLSNNLTPTAAAALTAANEPADSDFLADEGAEDENSIIVSIESDTAADSDDAINDNAFTEVPATEGSEETIADTLVAEVGEEAATADDNSDQLAAEANVETIEPASAAAAPQAAPEPQPEPQPEPALEPEPASASNAATVVASNSATQQPATAPSTPGNVLESPTWILVQDPKRFTVQMSASTDRASVESFLIRNDLPAPNSIFSFNRNGATWFALVHGLYDDIDSARTALRQMPETALRNQPWIRRIGQVQTALKEQN